MNESRGFHPQQPPLPLSSNPSLPSLALSGSSLGAFGQAGPMSITQPRWGTGGLGPNLNDLPPLLHPLPAAQPLPLNYQESVMMLYSNPRPTNQSRFMPTVPSSSTDYSTSRPGASFYPTQGAAVPVPPPTPTTGSAEANCNDVDPYYVPQLQSTLSPKRAKGQKKADGKQPTFLTKLYEILQTPKYNHILRWDDTGEFIIIDNPEELAAEILPKVFRQTRFASFSRQLNIYGWMRKISLRSPDGSFADPDTSTWYHQTLRRSSTNEDLIAIKRRVPPRPSQAQKKNARLAAEGGNNLNSPDSDEFSSPPGYNSPPNHILANLDENKSVDDFSPPNDNQPLPTSVSVSVPGGELASTSLLDNSSQSDSARRRLSMPTSFRPTMPSAISPRSALFDSRGVMPSMISGRANNLDFMAHSAPPSSTTFPPMPNSLALGLQGHNRTHSIHGTTGTCGFQTADGLASAGNVFVPRPFHPGADDMETDPLTRGTMEDPQYNKNPDSWARHAWGTLGNGMRPTKPSPTGDSPSTGNLGSSSGMSTFIPHDPFLATLRLTGGFARHSPPINGTAGTNGSKMPSQAVPSQTVSPGAYQAFSQSNADVPMNWMNPTPSPTQTILSTPNAQLRKHTPMKTERRGSITRGPYSSDPMRSKFISPHGPMRKVTCGRDLSFSFNQVFDADDVPSANLSGQPELFNGELKVEKDNSLDESL